ncbi:MAG: hypothetical protein JST35_00880 [Armatimonadetes bacterium]|jgi:hypothetical protein|nr:hypothetical protein [Armatimonadota bacterium]
MKGPLAFLLGVVAGIGATVAFQKVRQHVESAEDANLEEAIEAQLDVLASRVTPDKVSQN